MEGIKAGHDYSNVLVVVDDNDVAVLVLFLVDDDADNFLCAPGCPIHTYIHTYKYLKNEKLKF